jgi:dihydrofolate synthase/folylpolyglutamate synthase
MVVTDVGHNQDGMKAIARQLENTSHEDLHIVIGLVKDKEIEKILQQLPPFAQYYFTRAQIPRALPETELASRGEAIGLNGRSFPRLKDALQAAVSNARPKDLVLVCGSVFLVAEVNLKEISF